MTEIDNRGTVNHSEREQYLMDRIEVLKTKIKELEQVITVMEKNYQEACKQTTVL